MKLVLWLGDTPTEITEENAHGRHPYLVDVGDIRKAARTGQAIGIEGTESSSVPITLKNRVRRIIRAPLRARADIYDDDDALYFQGTVAALTYGAESTLEIDA